MKNPLFLLSIILFCACDSPTTSVESSDNTKLENGKWILEIQTDEVSFPLRMKLQNDSLTFINAGEAIAVDSFVVFGDSLQFAMPVYGSLFKGKINSSEKFSGEWHKKQAGPDYILPFSATYSKNGFSEINYNAHKNLSRYNINFSPDSDNIHPAVGEFFQRDSTLAGTILTETGDYRFLQGKQLGNQFWLSTFDGAHLLLFKGTRTNDTIHGNYFSGRSWKEPFVGFEDPDVKLTDPELLTSKTSDSVRFEAITLNGKEIIYNQKDFLGKVTIIQIMGTWCPNCLDETRYYKSLYDQFHSQGLEIIAVGFERGKTQKQKLNNLDRYKENLDIPFQVVLGGEADKSAASETFRMLSDISSFPTSIFIGKNGEIKRIHTGFYGPGTGDWYERYTTKTEAFIKALLAE